MRSRSTPSRPWSGSTTRQRLIGRWTLHRSPAAPAAYPCSSPRPDDRGRGVARRHVARVCASSARRLSNRRGDDRRDASRDSIRCDHLRRSGAGLSRACTCVQRHVHRARHARRQADQAGEGTVRAGAPLTFPTKTVAASTYLPDLDDIEGLPLELGRMEPTISDPARDAAVRHARRASRTRDR